MKKIFGAVVFSAAVMMGLHATAQDDKSKRPSPPAKVSETISSGATVTIDYSQPSVKGRTIGKEIAPYGEVWRTGANEATVFETSKDLKIEGKTLPAGKYSLYSIPGKETWTFIFNKVWNQWGTVYNQSEDALRVVVKPGKAPQFMEKMTFNIDKKGKISLLWGDIRVDMKAK